jgi:arylsulfatase A-like enzyme
VDIAPTLLRAANVPPDAALDGRPLQDVVAGRAAERPFLLTYCNEATGVRTPDGWKLVFPTPTGDKYGMPMQLYRLANDPHERKNLAQEPGAADMLRRLIKVREDTAAAFHLYDHEAVAPDDAEHLRRLEELGYVGR